MDAEAQLQDWLRQEREILDRVEGGAGFGLPEPSALMRLSGLEAFRAAARGELPAAPMEQSLDYHFLEAEHGRVLFQGNPRAQFLNPAGTVHGGWCAAMLDSCMTGAIYSLLPAGRGYSTLELSVNFVKALTPKVRCVRAEGKVIHVGRQIATAEGRLFGPGDVLFAHGKTTCFLTELRA